MQNIGIFAAKTRLSEVCDEVARTQVPVTITRRGTALVFIEPVSRSMENQYPVLPFDKPVADTFASLTGHMRRQGIPRPVLDLMIAATACRHGLIFATLNAQDFAGIPDLIAED